MLATISETLRSELLKAEIAAAITFRIKDPYSILKKMERKERHVKQLSDVIAFRIIVNQKDECYQALYVINNVYTSVTDKFKDFIFEPKENGYESLHTVIIPDLYNRSTEIQIRTWDMHQEASTGRASHYKTDSHNKKPEDAIFQKAYQILDQFLNTGKKSALHAYEQEINNIWELRQSLIW